VTLIINICKRPVFFSCFFPPQNITFRHGGTGVHSSGTMLSNTS